MRGGKSNNEHSSTNEEERNEMTSNEEEPRLFCISFNIYSFKATQNLPMRSINLFVRVELPEIVRAAVEASDLPSNITSSLRTHPPVFVERGTEVNISNGYVTLKLPASPIAMTAMLALGPEVKAYIIHRDKYAADSVLGVATLPMKFLMEQRVIDGYASVQGLSTIRGEIADVKIGSLRVVLAIEDIGAVVSTEPVKFRIGASPGPARQPHVNDLSVAQRNLLFSADCSKSKGDPSTVQTLDETEPGEIMMQALNSNSCETPCNERRKSAPASWKTTSLMGDPSLSDVDEHMKTKDEACKEDIRKLPEYEMAWEFEMWRRSEEARWLEGLKQQEAARMSELEADWRRKEIQRAAEMRNFQAVQVELEVKLRATLSKLEKRERSVNLAEETLERRKDALERAYANRTSDAQVAVKRLEAECGHRIDFERNKLTSLQEQYGVLEQRLATSNESLTNLEKQFQDYKSVLRNTKESDLLGQIFALKQQCCNLEQKCELAIHSRDDYKSQVMKMAKELAKLHRIQEVQRHQATEDKLRIESRAVAAIVKSQCKKAKEDRLELQSLKEQLSLLQLQEEKSLSATQDCEIVPKALHPKESPNMLEQREVAAVNTVSYTQNIHAPINAKPNLVGFEHKNSTFHECELISKEHKCKLERLQKQRAYLLSTGVYSVSDRVIKGLDQEIQILKTHIIDVV